MSTSQKNDTSSQNVISNILKAGTERGVLYVSAGFVVGGLASIVLARGGGGAGGARRAIAMFGTGVGTGAAWTKCSMDVEEAVKDMK
mmetsp:Transcript_17106/g.30903  ORF Transcript_17106/g.30903 Transcript_17106/m.30903 type:complete len:87 (+) Transcript_17106:230-490(+)|eukprot:CAMPEP_0201614682 /NCGR_PEP_ID=MMETSP0492-20130828/29362_1 /ASSEMBLY_ACC=CAM_ASM_000837 /TAXON_ID=420259 /ORGANISM="Thalassiosira gravida, Strain GMp14c1" /LENGTH=86 /DNA_ID=CAMNT_0048082059 /DNA_START=196 /DNA_END=456 /DNA_ORIENTATION=+